MALATSDDFSGRMDKEPTPRRRTPLYSDARGSSSKREMKVSCPDDSDDDLDTILRRLKNENERKYSDLTDSDSEIPSASHIRMYRHNRPFLNSQRSVYCFIFIVMAIFVYFVQIYNTKQLERLKEKYGLDVKKPTPEVWWRKTLFYYVYMKSFKDSNADGIGDINGLRENLNHFVYLGVEAVIISPINASPASSRRHAATDFKAIDRLFGDMEQFDQLVKDLHERDIKLVVEFVPNHTSKQHQWFIDSCHRRGKYKDYYIWDDGIILPNGTHRPPNNWRSLYGGSAWSWNEERGQFYYHYYAADAPDLNHRSTFVRQEMVEVLEFWLEKGIDGLRIDSPHVFLEADDVSMDEPMSGVEGVLPSQHEYLNHIFTEDQLDIHEFLATWGELVEVYTLKTKHKIILLVDVGEVSVGNAVKYYYTGADAPLSRALLGVGAGCGGRCVQEIVDMWMSHVPDEKDVIWLLSDSGGRLVEQKGAQYAAALNVLLLLLPGAAVTYYGEEIGMQHSETDGKANGTNTGVFGDERARSPMQWSSAPRAGFTAAATPWCPIHPHFIDVNVERLKATPHSLLRLHRSLAALRRQPSFQHGRLQMAVASDDVFSFIRFAPGATPYLVAINVGAHPATHDYTLSTGVQYAQLALHAGVGDGRGGLLPPPPRRLDLERLLLHPGEAVVVKLEFDMPAEGEASEPT